MFYFSATESTTLTNYLELLKQKIKNSANTNLTKLDELTAMDLAKMHGDSDIIKYLEPYCE